jgi:hypothetical protein
VTNSNGHVHKSTCCTTCFHNTRYAWVTNVSGHSVEELVAYFGEQACTVCFPDAPTFKGFADGTSVHAKLTAAEKQAKQDERQAKQDAKAAKEVLGTVGKRAGRVIFKTERSAEIRIVQRLTRAITLQHGVNEGQGAGHWGELIAEEIAGAYLIVEALVVKRGASSNDVLAPLEAKAWKKAAKEIRDAKKYREANPHLFS